MMDVDDDGSYADAFSLALGSLEGWTSSGDYASRRLRSLVTACSPRELLVAFAGESSRAAPSAARTAALCEGMWACLATFKANPRSLERHIETALDAVTCALHRVGGRGTSQSRGDVDNIASAARMAATLTALTCALIKPPPLRVTNAALCVAGGLAAAALTSFGPPTSWINDSDSDVAVAIRNIEAAVVACVRAATCGSTDADALFEIAANEARGLPAHRQSLSDATSPLEPHPTPRDAALIILFTNLAANLKRPVPQTHWQTPTPTSPQRLAAAQISLNIDSKSLNIDLDTNSNSTASLAAASLLFVLPNGPPLCSDVVSPRVRVARLLALLPPLAREAAEAAAASGLVLPNMRQDHGGRGGGGRTTTTLTQTKTRPKLLFTRLAFRSYTC